MAISLAPSDLNYRNFDPSEPRRPDNVILPTKAKKSASDSDIVNDGLAMAVMVIAIIGIFTKSRIVWLAGVMLVSNELNGVGNPSTIIFVLTAMFTVYFPIFTGAYH